MHPLADKVKSGDVRSVARACRLVDDAVPGYVELLKDLFASTGKAWIVGVTGNPGAGKSTVVDRLIEQFRREGTRTAVVAVDPTSPFSGGAILGDRIRMQRHAADPEVFIRSLATRGALGGLSRSARDVVRVLDAWGAGVIIVETVGVGQDELEVTRAAHTTMVVMAPGLGDDVQAIKAGILECADLFAVNKADREGADATVRDLELMIALGGEMVFAGAHSRGHTAGALDRGRERVQHAEGRWVPPVLKCVATRGEGIEPLVSRMKEHKIWLETTQEGTERTRRRTRAEIEHTLRDALFAESARALAPQIEAAVAEVESRTIDPYTATERLIASFRGR